MPVLINLLSSIVKGLPLFNSIKELVKPTKVVVPVEGNSVPPKVIKVDNSPFIQKVIMLIIEGCSVWGTVYLMKHFGVTYNDIINLFGLIHG